MSFSLPTYSQKLAIASVLAVTALALAGCGDGTSKATLVTAPTTEPTTASGASNATGATGTSSQTTPSTGKTGGNSPASGDASDTTSPDGAGAGDEEAASSPVQISLKGGKFGSTTPSTVHVAAFISIELDVDAKDAGPYTLTVDRAGTLKPYSFKAAKAYKVPLDGLRPGRSLTVKLGAQTVKVIADAEPGP